MKNKTEIIKQKNISFGEWLKGGFITLKVNSEGRSIKLLPKWLMIVILSLSYAGKYIGKEDISAVFLEFIFVSLFSGLIWYGFDYLIGKTKIVS